MKPPHEVLADEVLDLVVARNPNTERVQWTVSASWTTGHRPVWRAEAFHPGAYVRPRMAVGGDALEALRALVLDLRRG